MSCFLIPRDTCRKLKTMISNYWWGSSADNRHMHRQRWELLTRPKVQGGMGFQDLRLFNKAMLWKQGWRLIENPNSLCAKVLKGRYYHDADFLTATRKKHASHTWRAILESREVLRKGLMRRIGDGSMTIDVQRAGPARHARARAMHGPMGFGPSRHVVPTGLCRGGHHA